MSDPSRGLVRPAAIAAMGFALLLSGGAAPVAAADDRPDFTGIWTTYQGAEDRPRVAWPQDPPLKPEAKEKIAAYHALVDPRGDTPGAFCLGTGMPGSMLGSGPYPMEIIQKPAQITIVYEAHTEMRRVYLDGPKANVPDSDLFPTRNGYSTGHWEGDTLVVETSHLKEQVDQRSAHSAEAEIVEKYHLETGEDGNRVLVAELTMTDPNFYTEPVTVTKKWSEAPADTRMLFYECTEPDWEAHLEELRAEAAAREGTPTGE